MLSGISWLYTDSVPSATISWTKPWAEILVAAVRRPKRVEVVSIEGIFETKASE